MHSPEADQVKLDVVDFHSLLKGEVEDRDIHALDDEDDDKNLSQR